MAMVLVDSSVWVQHFRKGLVGLGALLNNDQVLCHPLIILELSCGSPPTPRKRTLQYLGALQTASIATIDETINFVELNKLYDCGCGAVEMALLASTLLTKNTQLWTQDKKLETLAKKMKICYRPSLH